eukprot:7328022-Prymnesium_polylepis.1
MGLPNISLPSRQHETMRWSFVSWPRVCTCRKKLISRSARLPGPGSGIGLPGPGVGDRSACARLGSSACARLGS